MLVNLVPSFTAFATTNNVALDYKMNKQEIIDITAQLIKLGEDPDELGYWLQIYGDLPEDKQALLYVNLKQELEALQKI